MKMTTITCCIFTLLMSIFLAGESRAVDVFWCRGEKISPGDSTYYVVKYCGEPAYKEDISAVEEGCEKIEKWHYDCIGRGHIDEFVFKSGILVDHTRGKESKGIRECK